MVSGFEGTLSVGGASSFIASSPSTVAELWVPRNFVRSKVDRIYNAQRTYRDVLHEIFQCSRYLGLLPICVEDEHVCFEPSCCLRESDMAEEGEEDVVPVLVG